MKCLICKNQRRTLNQTIDMIAKALVNNKKPSRSCQCLLIGKLKKSVTVGYWDEILNEFQWIDYTNEIRGRRK